MPQAKNEVKTDITLTIEPEPYIEMMKYAHEFSPNECSGVGLVERIDYTDDRIEFKVKKVYLPMQQNTAGTTDITDNELNKLNTQLVQDGEDTSLLKFHWHSHVDMSVFHSSTDNENYDDMKTGDYAISLVVNKKYNMLGSIHLYKPLRINVLNVEVEPPDIDLDDYEMPTALRKKIKANVEKVFKWQEENKPIPAVTYANGCSYCRKSWRECTCYYEYPYQGYNGYDSMAYVDGLEDDKDFYELLIQGEKAGLITLIQESDGKITGYINMSTGWSYDLTSERSYSML